MVSVFLVCYFLSAKVEDAAETTNICRKYRKNHYFSRCKQNKLSARTLKSGLKKNECNECDRKTGQDRPADFADAAGKCPPHYQGAGGTGKPLVYACLRAAEAAGEQRVYQEVCGCAGCRETESGFCGVLQGEDAAHELRHCRGLCADSGRDSRGDGVLQHLRQFRLPAKGACPRHEILSGIRSECAGTHRESGVGRECVCDGHREAGVRHTRLADAAPLLF